MAVFARMRPDGVAALLIMMLLAFALGGCADKIEFIASMPEIEANEIIGALQKVGIDSRKISGKEGMVGLTLEAKDVSRANDVLRAQGLPRERFVGMGQIFKKEGLISSPMEERARYLYALSQELSASISQIDGVVAADVHVVLPERGRPGETPTPATAAVFIKHQAGYNLETVLPQVKKLVASSIPNLTTDRVTVVLVSAQAIDLRPGDSSKESSEAGGRLVLIAIALGIALFFCLVIVGYLGWRFWWPTRKSVSDSSASS